MTYIFFSDNKWFLHPGDLPLKPEWINQDSETWYDELQDYNQSIADIKAKALEIANPEIFKDYGFASEGIRYKDQFCQWPGTFEKKSHSVQDHDCPGPLYEEVAHLVLPPEEKNMKTDEINLRLVKENKELQEQLKEERNRAIDATTQLNKATVYLHEERNRTIRLEKEVARLESDLSFILNLNNGK